MLPNIDSSILYQSSFIFHTISSYYQPQLTNNIIIDKVAGFQEDKVSAFAAIQPYIFLYIALWVILCLDMRLLDWAKLKLFPSIRQDTISKMFAYLNQHSHHYFQNNFAESC